jgi:NADH-quinone oxidoreductase subunit N
MQATLVWALFSPLLGAAVASLALLLAWSPRWRANARAVGALEWASLTAGLGGLAAQAALAWAARGATAQALDLTFHATPSGRLAIIAVDVALAAALVAGWVTSERRIHLHAYVASAGTLLAAAVLAEGRLEPVLLLFGGTLCAGALAGPAAAEFAGEQAATAALAKRLAGALKQVSLGAIGTSLLVAGSLLLERYGLNMDNRSLLAIGLGLVWVGIATRISVAPFSGGPSDLIEAAPTSAVVLLGAVAPAAIVVGGRLLAPLGPRLAEVPEAARGAALAVAGLAVLLAGARAMDLARAEPRQRLAVLIAAGVALQSAWALFGLFSGSPEGARGALLLAANIALGASLLVLASLAGSRLGIFVGAVSLLGLPPFGGFPGALLVSQAAANAGGGWLAVLSAGTLFAATAWVRDARGLLALEDGGQPVWARWATWALVAAQPAFMVAAFVFQSRL